jgi:hypothetical protein
MISLKKILNKEPQSINEVTLQKGKTYGGTKCEGGCFMGKEGLKKIIKISKDSPKDVFMFRDDNYSGLQPHFVKDGVIAKATVLNPAYDLEKHKVRNLNIGNDIIFSIRLFVSTNESVNEALDPKAEKFLDAIQVNDRSIKDLKNITVDATPQGNWSVYYKGKRMFTLNGKMLDDKTIMKYGLEHMDESLSEGKKIQRPVKFKSVNEEHDCGCNENHDCGCGGVHEHIHEDLSADANGIAGLTASRASAVKDFLEKNNINSNKLYLFLKKGNLKDRMDFVTALVGKPGNPIQKKVISQFSN